MCGIVGYIGNQSSKNILLKGLKKLEYRGYDSCGIATIQEQKIEIQKTVKRVENLEEITKEDKFAQIGIGHTRWATHGIPTEENAHPHIDYKKQFAIVHNGIIENYMELKKFLLEKGIPFYSSTDTEVIVNLISYYFDGDTKIAISKAIKELKGAFAFVLMEANNSETLFVAKRKSPLLVGCKDNEKFIASDISVIAEYSDQVYSLENDEIAEITKGSVKFYDIELNTITKEVLCSEILVHDTNLGTFQHYMQKEIYETPTVIRNALEDYFDENRNIKLNLPKELLDDIDKIVIIACGSAMHAGLAAKYTFEEMLGISVQVESASEFKYRRFLLTKKDLVIFISQSGETADTLAAQEIVKLNGIKHISIINVPNSTLARESDYVLYTKAGIEIAVAATKTYIMQVVILNILALEIAKIKNILIEKEYKQLVNELFEMPTNIESILNDTNVFHEYSRKIKDKSSMFFIGRGMDYYAVLEGSLKLKEISYIHSEAYQAGELKHGTIALIEKGTKVIAVCMNEELVEKTISNIKEVVARGAEVLYITNCDMIIEENCLEEIIRLPKFTSYFSPLLSVIPMQLIAYYTALEKGLDIDKPRNLAKSVTVE